MTNESGDLGRETVSGSQLSLVNRIFELSFACMLEEDLRSEDAYPVRPESKKAEINEDHSFVFRCVGIT